MRRALLPPAMLLALAGPAALPAAAQDCTVLQNETVTVTNRGTPNEVAYVVGADISCPGGRRIFTDYATIFRGTGIVDMRGNVRFTDPDRRLTSERAQYDRVTQRLHAFGDVRVRDVRTQSLLLADNLQYDEATPGREALMQAHRGTRRPRAILYREQQAGGAPSADSTIVDADLIEVRGESFFHAVGKAELTRDSLHATGHAIDYRQDTGELHVVRDADVTGPGYQLVGDTVRAVVVADTLRSVHARIGARLVTEDVVVEAPLIDVALGGGLVERMVAVIPEADRRGEARARATAETFRLAADSIEVVAPAQQLEEVVAVGRAFGEMLDTLPPLPLPPEALAHAGTDWMRGDTLRAFFIENPRAAIDSTADARVLDRVRAEGGPAAALYRKRPQPVRASAPPAEPEPDVDGTEAVVPAAPAPEIGYVLANQIELQLRDGEVTDVRAQGEVRGMYLQPGATRAVGDRGARRP